MRTRRMRHNSSSTAKDEDRNRLNDDEGATMVEDMQDPLGGELSAAHNHQEDQKKVDDQTPPGESGGQE